MSQDDVAVLIVDDRPDNLLALEAVLEPLDVRVAKATSGAEALRRLLSEEFAVILLDVQMPELDGFETARLVKARERTRNIPIIFLTAINREVEHQLEGYGSGAVDYMAKPFEPVVLRSKVSVFVDLFRQSRLIESQNQLLAQRLEERDRAQAALARQAVELERSNAELERFAFVASHDLREPLSVLGSLLALLADRHRAGSHADTEELLERAGSGVRRMCDMIERLLSYAQVSTGSLDFAEVDLGKVLDRARAELAERVQEVDARITADPLPTVVGDEFQLGRVFFHLLDNALEFRSDSDPEVHVGLTRRDDQWVISTRDNGIGMDAQEVARLFTMFVRLHPRERHPGAGLGLATCRRVVERHGGAIWAESIPGRGTTVSFTLPTGDSVPAGEGSRAGRA